jgi:hypothetical protein
MKDLRLLETLMAKHAYEKYLALLGVESKAYHADNICFADKGFQDDCVSSIRPLLSVELAVIIRMEQPSRKSRISHLGLRLYFLHAKQMFPEYISTILWLNKGERHDLQT